MTHRAIFLNSPKGHLDQFPSLYRHDLAVNDKAHRKHCIKTRRRLNIVQQNCNHQMASEQANTTAAVHGLHQTCPGIQQCCPQPRDTHKTRATMDKVQIQALRFISGAMRTTPTSACEIECNIEPLDIKDML